MFGSSSFDLPTYLASVERLVSSHKTMAQQDAENVAGSVGVGVGNTRVEGGAGTNNRPNIYILV